MKKYLICVILSLINFYMINAQDHYSEDWKQLQTYENEGKPKSAMEIAEAIYTKAKKEEHTDQMLKALLYKSKYMLDLEENAQLNIIKEFKAISAASTFPTKNIVENMLAHLYWQYFQNHRWQFYNRTKTTQKVDQEDFRTWDLETLFAEVHLHFQNSLQNGVLAQQTDIDKFDLLLSIYNKEDRKYRPTLYDFLNHNALAFYKTSETNITKPAYAFEINNPAYIKDVDTFTTLSFTTQDSLSLQFHALKIYQNLIKFHRKDAEPEALVDVNIQRLQYVKSNATFSDPNTILFKTLAKAQQQYAQHPIRTLYDYEVAQLYVTQGALYTPEGEDTHRWSLKKAIEICDTAITIFPNSRGATNCKALRAQIKLPKLAIQNEQFIPVQTTARLLFTYTNVDKVYLKALKVTQAQLEKFEKLWEEEEKVAFLKALPVATSWDVKLRNEQDYQQHTTEVVLSKLEQGTYIVVATLTETLTHEQLYAYGDMHVSNLVLVETNTSKGLIFQVVDRNTGKPIPNAKIHLKSNYRRNKELNTVLKTDEKGQASFASKTYYYDVSITVSAGKDTLYITGRHINEVYASSSEERTNYTTFLFTDRSIYRPGQTVYFKGIKMSSKGNKNHRVVPNQSAYARLLDVNGQEVHSLSLTTNDYGSFHGTFIVPTSGLTGQYRIETDRYQSTSFSVEEYKRPKFEVSFTPVKQIYKVHDTIELQGVAKAYAGSTITDAKVVYSVKRTVQYPRWCYGYYGYNRGGASQEITHGETITNEKGEYTIPFVAQPDTSIKKENLPIFRYEITADITDINGETRSTTTTVSVGYHTIEARLAIPEQLEATVKTHEISVTTQNLNGQAVSAKGTVRMFKLKAPKHPLRKRPWKAPDYDGFTKEEFTTLFPHDAYQNEDDYTQWEHDEKVYEQQFVTDKDAQGIQKLALGTIKSWKSGKYKIELQSTDPFGMPVKDIQYVTITQPKAKTISDQQLFEIITNQPTYKVGDEVLLTVRSASKDITITLDIEKKHKIVTTQLIHLSEGSKTIKIPVNQEDVGGFSVQYSFVNYNGHQSGSISIAVPYAPTALRITTKTFRDKLQPGQEETWSFTVKGPKGDQVAAELLASMYDASLDQFQPHGWAFNPIYQPTYYTYSARNANQSFGNMQFRVHGVSSPYGFDSPSYDQMNWFGFYFGHSNYGSRNQRKLRKISDPVLAAEVARESQVAAVAAADGATEAAAVAAADAAAVDFMGSSVGGQAKNEVAIAKPNQNEAPKETSLDEVTIRKNLQETAFFFPQLATDAAGNVSFEFTAPEALTRWKLQLLAHTKTMNAATHTLETVTQKELMVLPNPPRFLREGDQITFSTKIASLATKTLSGIVELQLFDALTNTPIDQRLQNTNKRQEFTVQAAGNTTISWTLQIPEDIQAVQYKIVAKAGEFSDGEQNALPVLSNRMLVTETLPMWVRSNQTKTFTLDKLKNNTSKSLKHHKLTLEMTSNPAWYAVQALPYLMEYPHECAEQTFSRYYANTLASHIANSNPRIQDVFNQWKSSDALLSNLEKNQELKSLIIQETPWLRDAQSETEQKKRIALLFDLNKMNSELQRALRKLQQMQYGSGGFPWFQGGRENRYITQHIASGFGHLSKLGVTSNDSDTQRMLNKAVQYLDQQFVKEYEDLKRYCKKYKVNINDNHLSYTQIQYLYMRSFFPEVKRPRSTNEAYAYYLGQAKKYWLSQSLYGQGMLALITHRNQDTSTATKIIRSLDEKSITSDELGMYWKANRGGWYWYQAPIETQALMIEVFSEVEAEPKRTEIVDNLKIWLLKHKQTNQWSTTKSTSEAVYALLLQGSDWLSVTDMVDITLGNQKVDPSQLEEVKVEAGTGYFKTAWNGKEVTPEMATATIAKKGKGITWGALYWQYFEDLDKITVAKTPLELRKKLFLKKNTDRGEEITEITENTTLQLGDLVRVRIELRSDRDMEFIHMKDMRAAGLEPVNVISRYKWQDGLGYYESTKDASTNFFFDYLPKGVYVFEYDLRVNNAGTFSNGITTIQSMYAPEFSSHSEGVRITVE